MVGFSRKAITPVNVRALVSSNERHDLVIGIVLSKSIQCVLSGIQFGFASTGRGPNCRAALPLYFDVAISRIGCIQVLFLFDSGKVSELDLRYVCRQ